MIVPLQLIEECAYDIAHLFSCSPMIGGKNSSTSKKIYNSNSWARFHNFSAARDRLTGSFKHYSECNIDSKKNFSYQWIDPDIDREKYKRLNKRLNPKHTFKGLNI